MRLNPNRGGEDGASGKGGRSRAARRSRSLFVGSDRLQRSCMSRRGAGRRPSPNDATHSRE